MFGNEVTIPCHLACSCVFNILHQSSNLGSRIHWQQWSRSQASSRSNVDNQALSPEASIFGTEWLGCLYFVHERTPSPTIFSEPPFQLSKHFWSRPLISSSHPLVILNEPSLNMYMAKVWQIHIAFWIPDHEYYKM